MNILEGPPQGYRVLLRLLSFWEDVHMPSPTAVNQCLLLPGLVSEPTGQMQKAGKPVT